MGNWNRRWLPRKKIHQEAPELSHRPFYTEPESSGVGQSSVPSWEKKFCLLVGSIPWGKVVVAKKYMHLHDDVVKWNDSAGEEEFSNAKERFWAASNGFPCEIPLPDPNMYIDEIDWNPHIDPELISDLDREYFNPDEGQKHKKAETANENAHNSDSVHSVRKHVNLRNGDNPWEGSDLKGTEALKNVAQGWNQWNDSINESSNLNDVENPWERSYTRANGTLKNNAWGSCGNKSWGSNQGQACNEQSKTYNPWEYGCQNDGYSEKVWCNAGNNSWDRDRRPINIHESREFRSGNTPWAHSLNHGNGSGKDRGWRDRGDNLGWKQEGSQTNERKHLDSKRYGGAWGALNGGCRKREGSHWYSPRYKGSRFQGDDYKTGHDCRKGPNQKRVSFA
ncbi:hypothetical protein U1Q18_022735 [Sarracenia purpurea var. burkii]